MAMRRKEKRSDRSKIDATPPWERRRPPTAAATTGPFDIRDEPADDLERVDLGALRIPASELEVRVDVSESQEVVSVTLVGAAGNMQLGAFAAPRSQGLWAEVREEIKASLAEQGGRGEDQEGEFGTDLFGVLGVDAGRLPVRFVGIDGPRWLLRAMLVGDVATDARVGGDFMEVLRNTIVVRGDDPLPVRDPIPLRLPPEVAEQIAAAVQA